MPDDRLAAVDVLFFLQALRGDFKGQDKIRAGMSPIAKTIMTKRIPASPKPKTGKMVSTNWIINHDTTTYAAATRRTLRRLSSSNKDKDWLPGVLDVRKLTLSTTQRPKNLQEKGPDTFSSFIDEVLVKIQGKQQHK